MPKFTMQTMFFILSIKLNVILHITYKVHVAHNMRT